MRSARLIPLARLVVVGAAAGALVYGASGADARWRVGPEAGASATARTAVTAYETLCPGTELAGNPLVDDVDTRAVVTAAPAPTGILRGLPLPAGGGRLTLTPGSDGTAAAPATDPAEEPDDAAESTTDRDAAGRLTVAAPDPVRVSATGSLAAGMLASQETQATGSLGAGLMTTACVRPAADAWLTAGGGEAGRQERLILVNPGENPVDITIDLLGADGPIDPGAAGLLTVPPLGRATVLLDALASGEESPAVHLRASGGFVTAILNDHRMDGVTPRGLEDAAPLAAPATEQVLPGVPGGHGTSVRVINPGETEAVVSVRYLTADGPRALPDGSGVLRVRAGSTAELALPEGLPSGTHALEVSSDTPVTAAAEIAPRGRSRDFAWTGAAARVSGLVGAVYPRATAERSRVLSLAATGGDAEVDIVLVAQDGAVTTRREAIPSDSAVTVDVSATRAVWVRGAGGTGSIVGAVLTSGPAGDGYGLSVLPLTQARLTTAQVAVQPVGPADAAPVRGPAGRPD